MERPDMAVLPGAQQNKIKDRHSTEAGINPDILVIQRLLP